MAVSKPAPAKSVVKVTPDRQTIADLRRGGHSSDDTPLVAAVREAEKITSSIHVIEYSAGEQELCAVEPQIVKIRAAMDSAACDNVINPEELPSDAEFEPNVNGKHFTGANDSHIERYGS